VPGLTTNTLHIVIRGSPTPQGSKRAFQPRRKDGTPAGRPVIVDETRVRLKSWRQAIVDAAVETMMDGKIPPMQGPLVMAVTFTLRRPQNHFRTGRNATLLREQAPPYPMGTPDIEKLVRAVSDALTDAGVWKDDAQVVGCWAHKVYPSGTWLQGATTWDTASISPVTVAGLPGCDAMPVPGAVIRIAQIGRTA
jgi:crossover junction endodeoxyribonuclease RusA